MANYQDKTAEPDSAPPANSSFIHTRQEIHFPYYMFDAESDTLKLSVKDIHI